jgi:plasmid stabilization system protein ParE
MRRIVLTDEANQRLNDQIDYLLERDATAPAKALRARVGDFVTHTLAPFPATGKYIVDRDLWESWIPGTRLVVWYQFTDEVLIVTTFWHTSQNRWSAP